MKRGWIKVHIAVDVKSKRLLGVEITDEKESGGASMTRRRVVRTLLD